MKFSLVQREKKILNQKQVSLSLFYNLGKRNSLYVVYLIHTRGVLAMRTKMFVYILVYSSFDLMILRDDRSFCSLCDNV